MMVVRAIAPVVNTLKMVVRAIAPVHDGGACHSTSGQYTQDGGACHSTSGQYTQDGGACHSTSGQYTQDEKCLLLSRAVASKKEVRFTQMVIGIKQCMSRSSGISHILSDTNSIDAHHYYMRNKIEKSHSAIERRHMF